MNHIRVCYNKLMQSPGVLMPFIRNFGEEDFDPGNIDSWDIGEAMVPVNAAMSYSIVISHVYADDLDVQLTCAVQGWPHLDYLIRVRLSRYNYQTYEFHPEETGLYEYHSLVACLGTQYDEAESSELVHFSGSGAPVLWLLDQEIVR